MYYQTIKFIEIFAACYVNRKGLKAEDKYSIRNDIMYDICIYCNYMYMIK